MAYRKIKPVIELVIRSLCKQPYPGHRKGCPNFNKSDGCPPNTPLLGEIFDLSKPIWAVWVDFDLAEHRDKLKRKHPKWSRRQLDCCLYWQGTALSWLKHEISNLITPRLLYGENSRLDVLYRPEAYGVNVTKTMADIGVDLEWPPVNIVRKIAFVGSRI